MATYYVYSGAAGAGTGADWTNAFTTLTAAFSGKAAGDVFYVAHDHAQSTAAAITLTAPGSLANPCQVICVNRAGSVPPVSADLRDTATVTTTGANAINLNAGDIAYWYGINFNCGTGASAASINIGTSNVSQFFKECSFNLLTTATASRIAISGSAGNLGVRLRWENCDVSFGNVSQGFNSAVGSALFEWVGGGVTGATMPTSLFINVPALTHIAGVDLSGLGSGKTLFPNSTVCTKAVLQHCKLGASATVAATPTGRVQRTDLIRCDSGDTNYRTERYSYEGTLTTETVIVRTGGATDGTTPIAWKIVTTANAKRIMPFEALPIVIWNETTGSAVTVTLEGIWGGGAVPTNADIWMDVEYLGTSGFPMGNFVTSGPADQLAAGTNLTSSSETWGGSTTKFKMSTTFTPQEKGPITIYVKAALASSTFYIDPKVAVS